MTNATKILLKGEIAVTKIFHLQSHNDFYHNGSSKQTYHLDPMRNNKNMIMDQDDSQVR